MTRLEWAVLLGVLTLWPLSMQGQVTIETVPVGNAGNGGEWSGESHGGYGADRMCGAVGYEYRIARYEVTSGQYCAFLNAVGGVDTYQIYSPDMWSSSYGCKIERYAGTGTAGDPYRYRVAADWADRPVNYVSWGDAARFANWLHNGQPSGAQDADTTENGAYSLAGATTDVQLSAVGRESDWTWAIPTEDEWYKAAYHKNDGVTASYFDYGTSSDVEPLNSLVDPDPGNHATFHEGGYTIGSPYYRTEAGAHESSGSPYGTFDQAGNVWEWIEPIIRDDRRGLRGGAFNDLDIGLLASNRYDSAVPTFEYFSLGIRVVEVPEPATLMLLAVGGLVFLRRHSRRVTT